MPIKLNISHKGKAFKIEAESSALEGKSLGDKIDGKILKHDFEGYELEITGGSDNAGFPMSKNIEGIALKRILLKKGWGMHKKPKGGKKKRQKLSDGLRLRKTVRGKVISDKISQLNLKLIKEGKKSLGEIFPEKREENPKDLETKPVAN